MKTNSLSVLRLPPLFHLANNTLQFLLIDHTQYALNKSQNENMVLHSVVIVSDSNTMVLHDIPRYFIECGATLHAIKGDPVILQIHFNSNL